MGRRRRGGVVVPGGVSGAPERPGRVRAAARGPMMPIVPKRTRFLRPPWRKRLAVDLPSANGGGPSALCPRSSSDQDLPVEFSLPRPDRIARRALILHTMSIAYDSLSDL
jgi:hypothetical protein